jgi:hypothetical protein
MALGTPRTITSLHLLKESIGFFRDFPIGLNCICNIEFIAVKQQTRVLQTIAPLYFGHLLVIFLSLPLKTVGHNFKPLSH